MTIPPEYLNQIVTGDARELAERIPEGSIDLIFTDPVYDRIDDYRWLAETAIRVLKPDRACMVFCGIGYLPETLAAMSGNGLDWQWQFVVYLSNNMQRASDIMFSKWQSLLWYAKGASKPHSYIQDLRLAPICGSPNHPWTKRSAGIAISHWLDAFTQADDIVWDPFTGGGTVPAVCKMLGRNYIAFEIEPDVAERARERVLNTQPPLFVLEPEQQEMQLA